MTQDSVDSELRDFKTYLMQDSANSVDSERIDVDTHLTQNSVNYEQIGVDPFLVQDSQQNTEIIDDIEVPIEFIEGKIDNYSTEPSITYKSKEETDFESIDECKTVDLQDK